MRKLLLLFAVLTVIGLASCSKGDNSEDYPASDLLEGTSWSAISNSLEDGVTYSDLSFTETEVYFSVRGGESKSGTYTYYEEIATFDAIFGEERESGTHISGNHTLVFLGFAYTKN